jgi:hypothetical protein
MNVLKSIYNFIVGDMTILIGVLITVIVLALIAFVPALASLQVASGFILVIAVLLIVTFSLAREIQPKK